MRKIQPRRTVGTALRYHETLACREARFDESGRLAVYPSFFFFLLSASSRFSLLSGLLFFYLLSEHLVRIGDDRGNALLIDRGFGQHMLRLDLLAAADQNGNCGLGGESVVFRAFDVLFGHDQSRSLNLVLAAELRGPLHQGLGVFAEEIHHYGHLLVFVGGHHRVEPLDQTGQAVVDSSGEDYGDGASAEPSHVAEGLAHLHAVIDAARLDDLERARAVAYLQPPAVGLLAGGCRPGKYHQERTRTDCHHSFHHLSS